MSNSEVSISEGFRLGATDVYPARGEIATGDETRRLEPRVMDVLVLLARRQGEVVSRDALIEDVWRGALVSDDVISRSIYQLRKELGDSERRLIKTIPKRGYSLMQPIAPLSPESCDQHPAAESPTAPGYRRHPALMPLVAGAAALAVLWLGVAWLNADSDAVRYTLAVRPFASETADQDPTLAPGFAEDLLNRLSRNRHLAVLARTSSFGSADELRSTLTGDDLVMLDGSLSAEGEQWIVDVRLIDASTGGELWRTRLVNEDLSIEDMQREIELGVLQALGALPDGLVLSGESFTSDDLEAYRLLLRGREHLRSRDPERLSAAVTAFGRAAGLDPDYAAAFISLAEARAHQVHYGGVAWDRVRAAARTAVSKGMALAPDSAHAHAVNGLVQYLDQDMELAEPSLRKAIELNPGYADAYMWLGRVYMAQGRIRDAIEEYRVSSVLSPLSAVPLMNLGMAYATAGRYDDAIEQYEKAIAIEPDIGNADWAMGYAYWHQGELPSALERFRKAEAKGVVSADYFAQFALVLFDAGQPAEGERYADKAAQLSHTRLWPVRARWGAYINRGDVPGLVAHFEDLDDDRRNGIWPQFNLAAAYAVAGRSAEASQIYETHHRARDSWFLYPWDVEWGFSHTLMLASVRRALGEPYDALLDDLRTLLAGFEEQQEPTSSPGITYVRASLAALEGDSERAVTLLEAAAARGWRRWWWTAVDPSWSELRETEAFASKLARWRAAAPVPGRLVQNSDKN